ncbi:hypothetical protein CRE_23863 [Caenorhabditis remanei]|uniref:Glycosyltransferase family 92 protein n=1 Tax=Caenorhabditis remanei TaxID=31234 RepID=E3NVP5_CAERE|nr:hypothetical protein CRE_23863 [Caenorhabditis remanei]
MTCYRNGVKYHKFDLFLSSFGSYFNYTNSQRELCQKVYCRYYNCLREEISNSSYQSIFFPMNVIRCPTRIGVKYMSISFDKEEMPQEPIPLVYRVFEAPIHEVSVCVGPIYGSESKWLEVAEFIEHYKLIGVRYFYFTVFNMNEYSRKIIDEYLRTGEIELTVVQSEYKTIDWQFHLLQINVISFSSSTDSPFLRLFRNVTNGVNIIRNGL